jgi:hypothetical protein
MASRRWHAGFLGKLHQQRKGFAGDAVLRVIQIQAGGFQREGIDPLGSPGFGEPLLHRRLADDVMVLRRAFQAGGQSAFVLGKSGTNARTRQAPASISSECDRKFRKWQQKVTRLAGLTVSDVGMSLP